MAVFSGGVVRLLAFLLVAIPFETAQAADEELKPVVDTNLRGANFMDAEVDLESIPRWCGFFPKRMRFGRCLDDVDDITNSTLNATNSSSNHSNETSDNAANPTTITTSAQPWTNQWPRTADEESRTADEESTTADFTVDSTTIPSPEVTEAKETSTTRSSKIEEVVGPSSSIPLVPTTLDPSSSEANKQVGTSLSSLTSPLSTTEESEETTPVFDDFSPTRTTRQMLVSTAVAETTAPPTVVTTLQREVSITASTTPAPIPETSKNAEQNSISTTVPQPPQRMATSEKTTQISTGAPSQTTADKTSVAATTLATIPETSKEAEQKSISTTAPQPPQRITTSEKITQISTSAPSQTTADKTSVAATFQTTSIEQVEASTSSRTLVVDSAVRPDEGNDELRPESDVKTTLPNVEDEDVTSPRIWPLWCQSIPNVTRAVICNTSNSCSCEAKCSEIPGEAQAWTFRCCSCESAGEGDVENKVPSLPRWCRMIPKRMRTGRCKETGGSVPPTTTGNYSLLSPDGSAPLWCQLVPEEYRYAACDADSATCGCADRCADLSKTMRDWSADCCGCSEQITTSTAVSATEENTTSTTAFTVSAGSYPVSTSKISQDPPVESTSLASSPTVTTAISLLVPGTSAGSPPVSTSKISQNPPVEGTSPASSPTVTTAISRLVPGTSAMQPLTGGVDNGNNSVVVDKSKDSGLPEPSENPQNNCSCASFCRLLVKRVWASRTQCCGCSVDETTSSLTPSENENGLPSWCRFRPRSPKCQRPGVDRTDSSTTSAMTTTADGVSGVPSESPSDLPTTPGSTGEHASTTTSGSPDAAFVSTTSAPSDSDNAVIGSGTTTEETIQTVVTVDATTDSNDLAAEPIPRWCKAIPRRFRGEQCSEGNETHACECADYCKRLTRRVQAWSPPCCGCRGVQEESDGTTSTQEPSPSREPSSPLPPHNSSIAPVANASHSVSDDEPGDEPADEPEDADSENDSQQPRWCRFIPARRRETCGFRCTCSPYCASISPSVQLWNPQCCGCNRTGDAANTDNTAMLPTNSRQPGGSESTSPSNNTTEHRPETGGLEVPRWCKAIPKRIRPEKCTTGAAADDDDSDANETVVVEPIPRWCHFLPAQYRGSACNGNTSGCQCASYCAYVPKRSRTWNPRCCACHLIEESDEGQDDEDEHDKSPESNSSIKEFPAWCRFLPRRQRSNVNACRGVGAHSGGGPDGDETEAEDDSERVPRWCKYVPKRYKRNVCEGTSQTNMTEDCTCSPYCRAVVASIRTKMTDCCGCHDLPDDIEEKESPAPDVQEIPRWCDFLAMKVRKQAKACNPPAASELENEEDQPSEDGFPRWCNLLVERARQMTKACNPVDEAVVNQSSEAETATPRWCDFLTAGARKITKRCNPFADVDNETVVANETSPQWCRFVPAKFRGPVCSGPVETTCPCASWCGKIPKVAQKMNKQCCSCADEAGEGNETERQGLPKWCRYLPEAARDNFKGCRGESEDYDQNSTDVKTISKNNPRWCTYVPERSHGKTCGGGDHCKCEGFCDNIPASAQSWNPQCCGCDTAVWAGYNVNLDKPAWCKYIPRSMRKGKCNDGENAESCSCQPWCQSTPRSSQAWNPECCACGKDEDDGNEDLAPKSAPTWCRFVPKKMRTSACDDLAPGIGQDASANGHCSCSNWCKAIPRRARKWSSPCCACDVDGGDRFKDIQPEWNPQDPWAEENSARPVDYLRSVFLLILLRAIA